MPGHNNTPDHTYLQVSQEDKKGDGKRAHLFGATDSLGLGNSFLINRPKYYLICPVEGWTMGEEKRGIKKRYVGDPVGTQVKTLLLKILTMTNGNINLI